MKTFAEFINEMAGLSNRKQTLINQIRRHIDPLTKGIFRDDSWQPVHQIFETFTNMGIDWKLTDSQYQQRPEDTMPTSKRWTFEINFINQSGRPDIIHGQVIASGAGSVQQPLDKYDLVVTMN